MTKQQPPEQSPLQPDQLTELSVSTELGKPARTFKRDGAKWLGFVAMGVGILALIAAYIHNINNVVGIPLVVVGAVLSIVSIIAAKVTESHKFYGVVGLILNVSALVAVMITNVIMKLAAQRAVAGVVLWYWAQL